MPEKDQKRSEWDTKETTIQVDLNDLQLKDKGLIPCLVVMAGELIGKTFPMNKPVITLGRMPDNDVCIDDPSISRKHAEIRLLSATNEEKQEDKLKYVLVDLGSTNGVYLNNQRISDYYSIEENDKIRIGKFYLKFVYYDQAEFEYHEKISKIILFDELTGLYTQRGVYEALSQEILRAERYRRIFSVLMVDIDHFKKINDTYGHLTGNTVLAQVGEITRKCFRKEIDRPGRWGGDEFLILLPETAEKPASIAAKRFCQQVAEHSFTYEDKPFNVTLSIGVAVYQQGETLLQLIDEADKALYQAKQNGRNQIYYPGQFFSSTQRIILPVQKKID